MPGMLPAWAANAALAGVLVFLVVGYLMNRNSQFFARAVSTAEFLPAIAVGVGVVLVVAAADVASAVGAGSQRVWTLMGVSVAVGAVLLWAASD